MNKLKYFLDKKLIWCFLLLFLIALIWPINYLWQYNKIEITVDQGLISLNEKEYKSFLAELEKEIYFGFKMNPFKKELINQEI